MKVLIIDDEVIIRNGLVQAIPWVENEYEILKPAASGEEAIVRIKEEQPDIIISDIQMQGMSGLELIGHIEKLTYPKEIILLTGYDEFNYVQEAIKQNVSDYLLKTSSPDEILESVNKARKRLEETRKYLQLKESELERDINYDLKHLLENELTEVAFERLIDKFPELKYTAFQLLVINTVIDAGHFYQSKELWNTYIVGRWLIYNGQTVIIAKRNPNLSDDYLLQMAAKKIKEIYQEPLFISNVITSLYDLPLAYDEVTSLLLYKWLLPEQVLIGINEVKGREGVSHHEDYQEHESQLLNCIKSGDKELLSLWVGKFVEWIFSHPMATPKSIEVYIQNLYFSATRYIDQIGHFKSETTHKHRISSPSKIWFMSPVGSLTVLFTQLLTDFEQIYRGSEMYVNDAVFYMNNHLGDSITLQEVARHVHIHPNYLSELIRKETGKSYLELLTDIRIKSAEDYLINTSAKVKEISNLVGYGDPKYFTSIFKRYFGITPSDYRKKKLVGK